MAGAVRRALEAVGDVEHVRETASSAARAAARLRTPLRHRK